MKTPIKYALIAGGGYALHAVLQRNKPETSKVYKPTPIEGETLAQKMVETVIRHMIEKAMPRFERQYTTNYASTGKKS